MVLVIHISLLNELLQPTNAIIQNQLENSGWEV